MNKPNIYIYIIYISWNIWNEPIPSQIVLVTYFNNELHRLVNAPTCACILQSVPDTFKWFLISIFNIRNPRTTTRLIPIDPLSPKLQKPNELQSIIIAFSTSVYFSAWRFYPFSKCSSQFIIHVQLLQRDGYEKKPSLTVNSEIASFNSTFL